MNLPGDIFIIDDDPMVAETLKDVLQANQFDCMVYNDPRKAVADLPTYNPKLVITDLQMPEMDGVAVLEACKLFSPACQVVVLTGYGSIELAVRAVKNGAFDFISKPYSPALIIEVIRRGLEKGRLSIDPKNKWEAEDARFADFWESKLSPKFLEELNSASRLLERGTPVLISGEVGSGKSTLARILHKRSRNRRGSLLIIDCATIFMEDAEAYLFGIAPEVLTESSHSKTVCRLASAPGGTIVLKCVESLSLPLQSRLLRVLGGGRFWSADKEPQSLEAQIILTTNDYPERLISKGLLLKEIPSVSAHPLIWAPPLRNLKFEIPEFAKFMLDDCCNRYGRGNLALTREAIDLLQVYDWPGNLHEMGRAMERAAILTQRGRVSVDALPPELVSVAQTRRQLLGKKSSLNTRDQDYILSVLVKHKGLHKEAAEDLGISERTLFRRLSAIRSTLLADKHPE